MKTKTRSNDPEEEKNIRSKRLKKLLTILKFAVLIIIVIGIPAYIIIFQRDMLSNFKSIQGGVTFLKKYETQSILVYIGFQVLQIVISVIPGQAFQFAAGYLFGFLPGLLYSVIGAIIGTTISFYLAKFLGKDAVHLFFGDEKMRYYIERLNSRKAYLIVFLLYLIPGLPKDIVSYAAGISEMKFKQFLVTSMVGRLFGMSGSLLIGAMYMKGEYKGMIVVAAIAVVLFVICVIRRKALVAYVDKFYDEAEDDQ